MLVILFDLGMWQSFQSQAEVTLDNFLKHVRV